MSEVLLSVPIGILCGLIVGTVTLKYGASLLKNNVLDMVSEVIDDLMQDIASNKEKQEKIFTLGAILGKGVRYGFGDIMGKGSGKFKLNDIIGIIAQNALPKLLGGLGGGGGSEPPSPSPQTNPAPTLGGNNQNW